MPSVLNYCRFFFFLLPLATAPPCFLATLAACFFLPSIASIEFGFSAHLLLPPCCSNAPTTVHHLQHTAKMRLVARLSTSFLLCALLAVIYQRTGDGFAVFPSPPMVASQHRLLAILDDSIDLSGDGGIFKRVVRRGNAAKGYPLTKDVVEIAWKLYGADGTVAHDSAALDEPFDFTIGADPRHVIVGWEAAVKTMFEGEVATYVIQPHYAFGDKGLPGLNVPPNAVLKCELELVRIKPSVARSFPSVGLNESIKEELVAKMQSGESVIADEVMQNKQINATKTDEQRRYFDPDKHRTDPKQRVRGEGRGFAWEETPTTIDVEVPLPPASAARDGLWTKDDVQVEVRAGTLSVALSPGGDGDAPAPRALLAGPLHGKVQPSACAWALLGADPAAPPGYRGQRVLVSLEKAHGSRDIWATVISREHLGQSSGEEEEEGEGDGEGQGERAAQP